MYVAFGSSQADVDGYAAPEVTAGTPFDDGQLCGPGAVGNHGSSLLSVLMRPLGCSEVEEDARISGPGSVGNGISRSVAVLVREGMVARIRDSSEHVEAAVATQDAPTQPGRIGVALQTAEVIVSGVAAVTVVV